MDTKDEEISKLKKRIAMLQDDLASMNKALYEQTSLIGRLWNRLHFLEEALNEPCWTPKRIRK